MTDKSRRSARAPWSRAGPASDQSQARTARQRKAIGCCRRGGGGSKGGAAFSFAFYAAAVTVADLRLSGLCLVVSRGNGFRFLSCGWELQKVLRGISAISLAGKVWFAPVRRRYNNPHGWRGAGEGSSFQTWCARPQFETVLKIVNLVLKFSLGENGSIKIRLSKRGV